MSPAVNILRGQSIASPSGSHDSLFSLLAKHTETHARRQTHPYYDYVYLAVTLSNRTHSLRASQNTESARSKAAAYICGNAALGKRIAESNSDFSCHPVCTFVDAFLCGRPLCAPRQMDKFSLSLRLTPLYIIFFATILVAFSAHMQNMRRASQTAIFVLIF